MTPPQRFCARLLIAAAVLIGLMFAVLGCAILIALAESPQHCPPNIGCPEHQQEGCPSWGGLLEPA
jgi:hypothetical protein